MLRLLFKEIILIWIALFLTSTILSGFSRVNRNNVAAESTAADGIYTLFGQKVMKAKKGLYIINGKKQVVR